MEWIPLDIYLKGDERGENRVEHAGALRGIYDDILSITSIDENGCEIVNNVEI